MRANYGGTELPTALEFVFEPRQPGILIMVFVLTDGEVCTTCFVWITFLSRIRRFILGTRPSLLWQTLSHVPALKRLYVSSVSVSVTTSPPLLSKALHAPEMAKAFLPSRTSIEDKCTILLRAVFPCIKNVTIDWGNPGRMRGPIPIHLSDSVHVGFESFSGV
jgi:hypothetical protein